MKADLDNLPTEDSTAQTPEIFSPTFRTNLSRFSITQSRREEILRFALQEAEQKLQSFKTAHRMIKGTLKEKTNILHHKIEKNRDDILRLDKQLEKLEQNSAMMTMAIKKQNQQKLEAFKVALQPLQDVMDMIHNGKTSLQSDLSEKDDSLKAFTEKESEFLASLEEKYREELKFDTEKKNVLARLEEMKNLHPWEYKEYIEDRETKEFLARTREEKKGKLVQLNAMDKVILDLNNQSEVLAMDIDRLKSTLYSQEAMVKNGNSLSQLEEFLNMQCSNFHSPLIGEVIEELCTLGNFPIQQMIYKEQFRLIEREELEMLESTKNQQEIYENKIEELTRTIEELEVEVYALVSVQQNDVNLEKQLVRARENLEKTKTDSKKIAKDYAVKSQVIAKWKSENRNILLITDTERIPTDDQVSEEFISRLSEFITDPEQWKAMNSVISRYCEKAKDRETMHSTFTSQKEKEDSLIENKIETLRKVRAIKTSKETERNTLHLEFEKILQTEKVTIKELESSKLEVESANKTLFKEKLRQTLNGNSSYAKIQKTYGEKAIKKLMEKETLELKKKVDQERLAIRAELERLYEEKLNWEKGQGSIKKDIAENFLMKLNEIQAEIKRIKKDKKEVEREIQILTEAENEAHLKLDQLAEQKRNELVKEAKKVACSHGGGRGERIDNLYKLRTKKEAEIVEFESELIKLECGLSDKETQAEMEIVKVKARIQNIKAELAEIDKATKQAQKLEKTISRIDITNSDFASDLDMASDDMRKHLDDPKRVLDEQRRHFEDAKRYLADPKRHLEDSKQLKDSRRLLEDPKRGKNAQKKSCSPGERLLVFSPYGSDNIKEAKDGEESSEMLQIIKPGVSKGNFSIFEDNFSVVSSELSCPPEPNYRYDETDLKLKPFFESVLPLLDGSVVYKMFKLKKPVHFDPLESKVNPPENSGYAVRKMKVNKGLSKIEIRQIGKNGVESSIMIDQILSVVVPASTNDIIRARGKAGNEVCSLEQKQEFDKAYRYMKGVGKVDQNSEAFIFKAKENHFFPFVVNLKNARIELMADGLQEFKMWVSGINLLLKNKPDLERLKYKIIEVKD